jgi:SAM-dependent methyltransferase
MGDFKPDWLAMREPADLAARSVRLTSLLADRLAEGPAGPGDTVLRVLDIGTGSGANMRYLAERLPPHQSWLLVDRDPALLAALPSRVRSWGVARGFAVTPLPDGVLVSDDRMRCQARTQRLDLAADRAACDADLFAGCGLVTASALLDLVSEEWLRSLAGRCHDAGAAVLFALTYDGRIHCSPPEPEDDTIRTLVNSHQRTDKGFGAAMGPTAPVSAARVFTDAGYDVQHDPSDWVLEPDARELQERLIEGWAAAATAIATGQESSIRSWSARRIAHVAAGCSRLIVGHEDLAGWLP